MAAFGGRVRRRDEPARGGDGERQGVKASAARLPLDNRKAMRKVAARRQEWQDEAWDNFDDIPEIKNTTWLGGNVMSKLRLYVAVRPLDNPEGDPIPATDPDSGIPLPLAQRATAELERIKNPLGGKPEIIRGFSMNFEIAAECYLHMRGPRVVNQTGPDGTIIPLLYPEEWSVRSVDEVEVKSDKVVIHQRPGDTGEDLDPTLDMIVRVWQRHPRWSYLPDNHMRGVLSECEALVLLSNQVKAIAKSAMSAGFFTLPNELGYTVVKPGDQDGENAEDDDPFLEMMVEQLTAPIEDPASAAAAAPGLIRGEAQYLHPDFLRHITFDRATDQYLEARIEARVLRIARGLNYPVETVLGHMNTTFANASQIDEALFRDHYDPKCVMLCDALTVGVLQPNLLDANEQPELVERLFVWYDAKAIIRSVDPLESADHGYDIGAISDAAWRQRKGWSEDDAPTPVERLVRSVLRLRSFDPGLSTAIMDLLGVPLDIPAAVPAGPDYGDTTNPPIDKSNEDVPAAPAASITNESTPYTGLTMEQALLEVFAAHRRGERISASARGLIEPALAAGGLQAALAAHNNPGRQLMDLDRNLRAKLCASADAALTRVLERAGNRLKAKAQANLRTVIRSTHPIYAASTLGPKLVASSGITDVDLIGTDAWDGLERQFTEWVKGAQSRALQIANKVVKMSVGQRQSLKDRQTHDRVEAWTWLRDELDHLAYVRLYQPDPQQPALGEFDPTSKVPVGLMRLAIARAGGASGLTAPSPVLRAAAGSDGNVYVATNNGQPAGGIGTGELITGAITDGGAEIDGYEWTYGPAFRLHPFEEHEALDGEQFVNFDDDVLTAGDWIGDYYFPGDHDGCSCDFTPIVLSPEEAAAAGNASSSDMTDVTPSDVVEEDSTTPTAVPAPKKGKTQ